MDELIKILEDLKPGIDFKNDTRLISDGKLTSLDIMQLLMEIRDTFDVVISPLDIIPENFESVIKIYTLIEKLQNDD